jgi:hypothetical protein
MLEFRMKETPMTASILMKNNVAARHFFLLISVILVFAATALGQIQQAALAATLKGAEATSTITIGIPGRPWAIAPRIR